MSRLALILAAAFVLAGCATQAPAQLEEARRSVPTCEAGPDCAAKWDAAQLWIVQHAGFKLQTSTGVVLQTFGPSTAMHSSTSLAATVTREPAGPQRFRIVARIGCGNPFGCTPEVLPALLDFNRTVGAASAQ